MSRDLDIDDAVAHYPEAKAELAALRSQLETATDKALRFDLDQLGVERREREAVELVELRAENAELREERALIIQRAENAEAALVAEVAKNGHHAMRVTIAQLEARLQKVMARCADLLDEDQFNELDAIASSASGVQYKPCEICTTQSWCETHGCQCYPTEAMCCVDYPRCDCNSPPEPDNAPALQPCGHPWKAQHDSKCILCSSPGVTP